MSGTSRQSGIQAVASMTGGAAAIVDVSPLRHHQGVRACLACRQMKMKCEGSENPPCIRCQKAGRECLQQTSTRPKGYQEPQQTSTRPKGHQEPQQHDGNTNQDGIRTRSHVSAPTARPQTNTFGFLPDPKPSSAEHRVESIIPSIYSTPPVDAVLEPQFKTSSSPRSFESTGLGKRKRQSTYSPSNETLTPITSTLEVDRTLLSRIDMKEMIHLFTQRHLPFICVLRPKDFEDVDKLIENDLQLVYCICFVTARYLPGGNEVRERLLSEVTKIPRAVLSMQSGGSHVNELSALKCLFVLCVYADLTPPSRSSTPSVTSEVQFWYLRSIIEMYGTRLGLHGSIQNLRAQLRSNPEGITDTEAYEKYTCWLFMFSASHYTSIVSGTPPTMHIDSSIRAAPLLMQEIGDQMSSCNRILFGQIDLNLIWERASAQHPRLGEWWALPDTSEAIDENSVEAVLRDTEREIDVWYEKWSDYIHASDQGAFLDFTARFTRFCITSYAIKFLRSSSQSLTPLQKDQIRRSVTCASHVLEWSLSRSPIQKDRLRYVDDTACVMNSFCCLFIISVCQSYASAIPDIFDILENVTETAQLMIDLQVGFDDGNTIHVQGSFILKRAESMRTALASSKSLERQQDQPVPSPPPSNGGGIPDPAGSVSFEGLDLMLSEEGFYDMEPIWDFSFLFPSV